MLRGECDIFVTGQVARSKGAACFPDWLYWYAIRIRRETQPIRFWLKNFRYRRRIAALHRSLGVPPGYGHRHALPLQFEPRDLVPVGPDIYQREQRLLPGAAQAWQAMAGAAAADGIDLQLVSAFRGVDYQADILRRKLSQGQPIGDILRVSAAPGYSEHHSGRAVDLTTPGCAVLEEAFERTSAFAWLTQRGPEFGFRMSYPRNNRHGVAYEPWHWAWWGDQRQQEQPS